MVSQSSHETCAAPLAPSTDREVTTGHPPDVSPDPNVDSGEALEKLWDQPESPDLGSQQPALTGPEPRNSQFEEENNAFLRLSFPRKLWMIIEDAAFTSVHWNDEGDTVVIEAYLFQAEVLQHRGTDRIFETDSIKTFIHELNQYIYHGSKFQGDKPLLLRCSFLFYGLWFIDSVAGQARENHLPSELGGPSGEGMSSNSMSVSPATAGRDGAGQLPKSPSRYPDYGSVAVSVVAPNEAPEADEEQEESSGYTCSLCEQFKYNPNP
ncbi:hypothetical protein FD754_020631 [Muntiacus muntjak]|uniref:HSF-type DNA-binding domain-containing protein n=1 Tax=Muntiacus muntjak TaxID=9888 RepID=A0A5N3V3K4_MUNMU|nr:hypothetical protein FD754_020631 [Muntiacus muntjak]